jgi:hypothetical protein
MDRLHSKGDRQMRFADARRADEQDVFEMCDESGRCQFFNELFVDGRIKGKIEIINSFCVRKRSLFEFSENRDTAVHETSLPASVCRVVWLSLII